MSKMHRINLSIDIVICIICIGSAVAETPQEAIEAIRPAIPDEVWNKFQEEGGVEKLFGKSRRDITSEELEDKSDNIGLKSAESDEREEKLSKELASLSKRESETLYLNIINISLPNLLSSLGKRDVHEMEQANQTEESNLDRQRRESETLYLNLVNISLPNLLADLGGKKKRDVHKIEQANETEESNLDRQRRESETLYLNLVNISLPNLLADLGGKKKRDLSADLGKTDVDEQVPVEESLLDRQLRESETLYLNIINISLPNLLADLGGKKKRDTVHLEPMENEHKEKRQAPSTSKPPCTKTA